MDIAALAARVSAAESIQQVTGAAQAADVDQVSVALFDQALEVQKQLAAQLLQTLGVGGNLDLFA